jgi:hypothetical protein
VQFSREIEVFHLAPMTSIGLRDPLENRTPQHDATTGTIWRLTLRPGGPGGLARMNGMSKRRLNQLVATMPKNNPSGKPNQCHSVASSASHHGNSG